MCRAINVQQKASALLYYICYIDFIHIPQLVLPLVIKQFSIEAQPATCNVQLLPWLLLQQRLLRILSGVIKTEFIAHARNRCDAPIPRCFSFSYRFPLWLPLSLHLSLSHRFYYVFHSVCRRIINHDACELR